MDFLETKTIFLSHSYVIFFPTSPFPDSCQEFEVWIDCFIFAVSCFWHSVVIDQEHFVPYFTGPTNSCLVVASFSYLSYYGEEVFLLDVTIFDEGDLLIQSSDTKVKKK